MKRYMKWNDKLQMKNAGKWIWEVYKSLTIYKFSIIIKIHIILAHYTMCLARDIIISSGIIDSLLIVALVNMSVNIFEGKFWVTQMDQ